MKTRLTILVGISTLFFSLFLTCFLINSYLKLTPPKTFLLSIDLSLLSPQQVNQALIANFSLPQIIILTSPSANFPLNPEIFSATIDYSSTLSKLFFKFNLKKSLFPQLNQFFSLKKHSLSLNYDTSLLSDYVATVSAQIDQPFIPTQLNLSSSKKEIILTPGKLGSSIDFSALTQSILYQLSHNNDSPLPIPIEKVGYLPSDRLISQVKSQAQKLIDKKITLTGDFVAWTIDDQTLISWIDFNTLLNADKLNQFSQTTAQSVNREPINAIFKFENNQVLEFRPAKDGLSVKQSELTRLLEQSIADLIATTSSSLSLVLPAAATPPLVNTEDVNNLGIKELLGRGTSTFKHSSNIRNYNIQKGSSVINHLLVAPGDTFSFLNALGEVTLKNGYKKAYIIREGRTELDVGGGICQVSTTFFRAMLNSGVEITERHPHAFRVSYYEEDRQPGYDATVFIPSPDLRFKNDTPNHILIQSTFDGINKVLTYEFYGTSDSRQVTIENYKKWGYQSPPPTRYIDDPTLPPGKLVREEHAVAGIKTSFDWLVTKNNQIFHQKTFYSNYTPWAAVFRRGI